MAAHLVVTIVACLNFLCAARLMQSTPKDGSDDPVGWAWKDAQSHHKPPNSAESSVTSGHAWKASKHQPEVFSNDGPEVMPVSAQLPGKVLKPNFNGQSAQESLHESDITKISKSGLRAGSDSSSSGSLEDTLDQDLKANMCLDDFMPKCLKHTHSLIADLDYNYGDAQLETVLRNWCQSAQEFPLSRGNQKTIGFKEHGTCTSFASDLANARFIELKTTSDKGYRTFCTAFYEHHGGFQMAQKKVEPKEPPRRSGAPWCGVSVFIMGLVLLLA